MLFVFHWFDLIQLGYTGNYVCDAMIVGRRDPLDKGLALHFFRGISRAKANFGQLQHGKIILVVPHAVEMRQIDAQKPGKPADLFSFGAA